MKKGSKNSGGRQTPGTPAKATAAPRRDPTPEEIRDRAHKLYLQRGGAEGHAIDDWLAAERELRAERP